MRLHTDVNLPWWGFLLIGLLLLTQSLWLFTDARKREANAWFWGIWGLISCPLPTLLYLILVRKLFRSKGA